MKQEGAGLYRGVRVLDEHVLLLIPHSIQANDGTTEAKQLAYLHSGQELPVNVREQGRICTGRMQMLMPSVLPL